MFVLMTSPGYFALAARLHAFATHVADAEGEEALRRHHAIALQRRSRA